LYTDKGYNISLLIYIGFWIDLSVNVKKKMLWLVKILDLECKQGKVNNSLLYIKKKLQVTMKKCIKKK
jgi:hypothetical protein